MTPRQTDAALSLYHFLSQQGATRPVQHSDLLLVFGCNDRRVAHHAAKLWHQGQQPNIIISGGYGRLTKQSFKQPEAHIFAEILQRNQIPSHAIHTETQATNTQENIIFSLRKFNKLIHQAQRITLICKPIMCQRVNATVNMHAKLNTNLSCPIYTLDFGANTPEIQLICHQMVGEIDRLQHYPLQQYCLKTDIPEVLLMHQQCLIEHGFTQHRIHHR